MDLLRKYDALSATNNVNVLGIDMVQETAEQWDLLKAEHFHKAPTRLMACMTNEDWNPILNHGNLFLGVVHHSVIDRVTYRIDGQFEQLAVLYDGYWRPTELPVPIDSLPGELEVQVRTRHPNIEVAWLLVPQPEHQAVFADTDPHEFLPLHCTLDCTLERLGRKASVACGGGTPHKCPNPLGSKASSSAGAKPRISSQPSNFTANRRF